MISDHQAFQNLRRAPLGELSGLASDDEDLARRLIPYIGVNNVVADEVIPLIGNYRRLMPSLPQDELVVRITTDLGFWGNAVRQAEALAVNAAAPVYAFECAWRTPCFGGMWAPHGAVLPFIFNNQEYPSAWDGRDNERQRALADPGGRRFELGDEVFEAFISFARCGDPSTGTHPWSPYDIATRATMVFGSSTELVYDNRGEMRLHVTGLSVS